MIEFILYLILGLYISIVINIALIASIIMILDNKDKKTTHSALCTVECVVT